MKPIDFPEKNKVFGADQPEYLPLPALLKDDPNGETVSCWRMSIRERLIVLYTGKVWLSLWTFRYVDGPNKGQNKPLTPSYLTTVKRELIQTQAPWWLIGWYRIKVAFYKLIMRPKKSI